MKPGYRDSWFYPLEYMSVFDKGDLPLLKEMVFLKQKREEINKYVRQLD